MAAEAVRGDSLPHLRYHTPAEQCNCGLISIGCDCYLNVLPASERRGKHNKQQYT